MVRHKFFICSPKAFQSFSAFHLLTVIQQDVHVIGRHPWETLALVSGKFPCVMCESWTDVLFVFTLQNDSRLLTQMFSSSTGCLGQTELLYKPLNEELQECLCHSGHMTEGITGRCPWGSWVGRCCLWWVTGHNDKECDCSLVDRMDLDRMLHCSCCLRCYWWSALEREEHWRLKVGNAHKLSDESRFKCV